MDEAGKRRLAGAAVVVALVVIFVPMLVEEPEPGGLGEPIVVPEPPEFDSRLAPAVVTPEPAPDLVPPLPSPEPPGGPPGQVIPEPPLVAAPPQSDQPGVEPVIEPAPPSAEPVVETPAPPPVPAGTRSWVVQVASLGSMDAATRMQNDLRAKGYAAFVERAEVGGKTYFRVRIGPELERGRADGIAKRVAGDTGAKPLVQSYP